LQILYLWDMHRQQRQASPKPDAEDSKPPAGLTVRDALAAFYSPLMADEDRDAPAPSRFTEELVTGVAECAAELDEQIRKHSAHWRLERMPVVDRNLLRLAVYEMTRMSTPPPIVIDEALRLAKRFSNEASVAFINGVLDAVRREQEEQGPPASPAGA